MRVVVITLLFTFFSSLGFAEGNGRAGSFAGEDCINCEGTLTGSPLTQLYESTYAIEQAIESNKRRVDLMKTKITWGFLGVDVGKADVYLTEKDGKIVDLNVYAKVGVLGINSEIKQKVTLDQLEAGQPLKFNMEGSNRAVLVIEPEADFDAEGGWATMKIWNGQAYMTEKIAIFKDNGKWKAYKGTIQPAKVIKGLDIHMSGMSIPSMHVKKYKIKH
jgi:hypothetical protein